MSLEAEVLQLMNDAAEAEPIVLDARLGTTEKGRNVSTKEELDLLWALVSGVRRGVIRVARELDQQREP
jgi:hypothetical protein